MKRIFSLVSLVVFATSLIFLPGFNAKVIAADTAPIVTAQAIEGAAAAGAEGGMATFTGISTGTIIAGTVAAGVAAAWIIGAASNGDSDSTTTTTHH
jgi:hypothetical protein